MNHNNLYRVMGIAPNPKAEMAYVWCRTASQADPVLLGTGHIVGDDGTQPPGIRAGQFAVSFQLPPACIADSIVVTDSRDSKAFLENVTVLRC